MSKKKNEVVIVKKYKNRKLYANKKYITLTDIWNLFVEGKEVEVHDYKDTSNPVDGTISALASFFKHEDGFVKFVLENEPDTIVDAYVRYLNSFDNNTVRDTANDSESDIFVSGV